MNKIVMLIAFFATNILFADIIYLNNGKQIEGKIIQQTKEKVQVQISDGSTQIINKIEIQRIIYSKTQQEIQEEQKRKQEEELKRKQEEELKRKQEEELKRKQEEELKRKQEEELKRKQEEELKRREQVVKTDSTFTYLKSCLFPGLGYFDLSQNNKGYFWGGLFLASLGYYRYNYQKTIVFKNTYKDSTKNLNLILALELVEFQSIEYFIFTTQINQYANHFQKSAKQLVASGILILAVYLTQFPFLKKDLEVSFEQNQYIADSCIDCQTIFRYSTRF